MMETAHKRRNYFIAIIILVAVGFIVAKKVPFKKFFPDAASRLADEIKEGAETAKKQGRFTLEHKLLEKPDGCAQNYTLKIENNSLSILCIFI